MFHLFVCSDIHYKYCFIFLITFFQFSKGWSFGEKICETSKSHYLLKPYEFISEKVSHVISMVFWQNQCGLTLQLLLDFYLNQADNIVDW